MASNSGPSFVEQQSITERDPKGHLRAWKKFNRFRRGNAFSLSPPASLDVPMMESMNAAFSKGEQSFAGNAWLAAVGFRDPLLGRPREVQLPRAKKAMQGWRWLCPAISRLPLVWEIRAGMCMLFLGQGLWQVAAAGLIRTVFYRRPRMLLRITVGAAVRPLPAAGPNHRRWTPRLHEYVDGGSVPSLTQELDETLSLVLPWYVFPGPVLERLIAKRPRAELRFQASTRELTEGTRWAAIRLGMKQAVLPYQLRHTGASTDFAIDDRTLSALLRRGRWRNEGSARRYEKGSQLTHPPLVLPEVVVALRIESSLRPPVALVGRSAPLACRGN